MNACRWMQVGAAVIGVWFVGCGGAPEPVGESRLEVGNYLRAECSDYVADDATLAALLLYGELDRLDGTGRFEFLATASSCPQSPVSIRHACERCVTAMANQLYGEP